MIAPAVLSLLVWIYLLTAHGRFWQSGPVLPIRVPVTTPAVTIVIPARDEAGVIAETLRSLLAQDYAGAFRIVLVDDNSTDATAAIARAIDDPRLAIITATQRPEGWSGKLWAVSQGTTRADTELVLLTDADIVHDPAHLRTLVAAIDNKDLVSEMVELNRDSLAERVLVPAFVFFFQLLYPFARVNDPASKTAAAAGGTILIRQTALHRIGGIESIRHALIDDVALAAAVKKGGPIWLGHANLARSVRPYPHVADIWRMITRTAYVQLRFSPFLLAAATFGMATTWLVPPAATLFAEGPAHYCGLIAWIMMTMSYVPTLLRFRRPRLWALFLPLIAAFYMAATIASALNHHLGRGVAWKGRAYQ